MVRALRLQRQVCLLGQVPQPRLFAIYPMADLVVLTSRSEGIPLVLMEAMAHGRLVLAPAITGIPELIQHGKNGFLYESESILDFLDSVRWILDRRFSLEEVRRSAVETISTHYDRQKNIRSFADHFLARLSEPSDDQEDPLLQQVQLSV
jgi:glycosyltransferase involved in cell wall biosynthesis